MISHTASRIIAYAPATVANLGVGFDVLGMALDSPGDVVTAEYRERPGVELVAITGDGGQLPADPAHNTACIAAQETLNALGETGGVRLWLDKGLPLSSGLGSSAASAVAAAVAVNALFGAPLPLSGLLPACIEAEAIASGRHADNVAPALWGGIVLIAGLEAGTIHSLPVPENIHLAIVTPGVAVPTVQARSILPPTVPLRAMVTQTASIAALVHALHTGDLALLARSMEQDTVVSPARAALIPGLVPAQEAARQAGALAVIISGAGPTLCALCDSPKTAESVSAAFTQTYAALDMPCAAGTARPSLSGARIIT